MIDAVSGAMPGLALAQPAARAAKSSGQGFAEVLAGLMRQTAANISQGEAAAVAGIEGRLDTYSVVQQVMAAERTLQAAIAIRDKAVGAYLEINRMQI